MFRSGRILTGSADFGSSQMHAHLAFLHAKPGTAVARLSHHNFVCLSICLSIGRSVKNGASQDHQIFTVACLEYFSFRIRKALP